MKVYFVIAIVLGITPLVVGQTGFIKLYPDYPGYIIWDVQTRNDTVFALFSDFFEDDSNPFPNALNFIDVYGDIHHSITLTPIETGNPSDLFINDSKFYCLGFKLNSSDLFVIEGDIHNPSFSVSSYSGLPDNNFILSHAWMVSEENITIIANILGSLGPMQVINYSKENLSSSPSLKPMDSYSGVAQNLIPARDSSGNNLFMATGLVLLDSNFQFIEQIGKNLMVSKDGNVIQAIDTGYVAFSKIYDTSYESNLGLGLCKISPDYSVSKVTSFGIPLDDYAIPAINTCLDKDTSSYFFACHKDVELTLYTDTVKHLYYLGKYDKDLNQVWLKILGGDRKYLIAGIKADGHGGCYLHGMTREWQYDYVSIPFLMRFDPDGLISSAHDPGMDNFEFTLLGNPGRDLFRFQFLADRPGYTLHIVDIQGRTMISSPIQDGLKEIPTSWWPSGPYTFHLLGVDGSLITSGKWLKVE
ncbi:MAG: hypothetical protein H6568_03015 [Lewinellaceae bacterium]|nr:hypothetical protein [Saprospiraceae bacterium]MCB9311711.1 hypothetical protein [Lewinellaceae bacterium]